MLNASHHLAVAPQAQVLPDAAASKRKDLIQERHSKGMVPVMFFGTIEVAWVKSTELVPFKDGLDQGLHARNKTKPFLLALTQVLGAWAVLGSGQGHGCAARAGGCLGRATDVTGAVIAARQGATWLSA